MIINFPRSAMRAFPRPCCQVAGLRRSQAGIRFKLTPSQVFEAHNFTSLHTKASRAVAVILHFCPV